MESEINTVPVKERKDAYNIVFLTFILQGIGFIMPWNLFMNANSYFVDYKLNTTMSSKSNYRIHFISYISFAAQIPPLISITFNLFYRSTKQTGFINNLKKVVCVIGLEISVLIVTVILAAVNTDSWSFVFFVITIISIIILNSLNGIYQSSTYVLASPLPMKYTNAIVFGGNICGIIVSLLNIFTKLMANKNLKNMAIFYFLGGKLILFTCMITVWCLQKNSYFKKFIEIEKSNLLLEENQQKELISEGFFKDQKKILISCFPCCCPQKYYNKSKKDAFLDYWKIYAESLKLSWKSMLSTYMIFHSTFMFFPIIFVMVQPIQYKVIKFWFTDIFVFLNFGFFGFIGNIIAGFFQISMNLVCIFSFLRLALFTPFFSLCNTLDNIVRNPTYVHINHDLIFFFGVASFALTFGYLSSLALMNSTKGIKESKYTFYISTMSAFCIILGIFTGLTMSSFISVAIANF